MKQPPQPSLERALARYHRRMAAWIPRAFRIGYARVKRRLPRPLLLFIAFAAALALCAVRTPQFLALPTVLGSDLVFYWQTGYYIAAMRTALFLFGCLLMIAALINLAALAHEGFSLVKQPSGKKYRTAQRSLAWSMVCAVVATALFGSSHVLDGAVDREQRQRIADIAVIGSVWRIPPAAAAEILTGHAVVGAGPEIAAIEHDLRHANPWTQSMLHKHLEIQARWAVVAAAKHRP